MLQILVKSRVPWQIGMVICHINNISFEKPSAQCQRVKSFQNTLTALVGHRMTDVFWNVISSYRCAVKKVTTDGACAAKSSPLRTAQPDFASEICQHMQ